MEESKESESINVRFVLRKIHSNEDECSQDMKLAFKTCMEYDKGLCSSWIVEDSILPSTPTKRDVFVFEAFEGRMFNNLRTSKSVILGPRALLMCILEEVPIPNEVSAMFTIAMNKLVIATTSFNKAQKEAMEEKIGFMGGFYDHHILKGTTHLVANRVDTVKYEKARELGITCVTAKWVDAVWEASQVRNVRATDPEFDVYKCPPFQGLIMSCTGLPRQEKERVKNIISKNGGELRGVLELNTTKILIVNSTKSDKYRAAVSWEVPCVTPSWIYECEKLGYAVDVADHLIDKNQILKDVRKCSTPNLDQTAPMHDLSAMSSIHNDESMMQKTHCDETAMSDTTSCMISQRRRPASSCTDWASKCAEKMDLLDVREAKKAGNFLDGCTVYLSGFTPDMTEKLRKVLNNGGATRINEITSSVSHIIAGEFVANDMKALKFCSNRPHVVRVDWIIESIKMRCPAPEERFSCFETQPPASEPPSPSLKKGVQLLQPKLVPVPFLLPADDEEESLADVGLQSHLIPQYMNKDETFNDLGGRNLYDKVKSTVTGPKSEVTTNNHTPGSIMYTQEDTQSSTVFIGLKFLVVGFDDDHEQQMICEEMIQRGGGEIVRRAFSGVPNYGVVPFKGASLLHPTDEIVISLWLEDCLMATERLPVQYYHQPVALPSKPHILAGCVIGMSSYCGKEREFLSKLADALGAKPQEVFARKDNKAKNAIASTHLVCKETGSTKYIAAIKWKLPAVSHEWLLACLRQGKRVPEENFLVTDVPTAELFEKTSSSTVSTSSENKSKCPTVEQIVSKVSSEKHESNQARSEERSDDASPVKNANVDTVKMADTTAIENLSVTEPMETSTEGLKENVSVLMGPPTPINTKQHYGFSQETPIQIKRTKCLTPIRRTSAKANNTSVTLERTSDGDTLYRPACMTTPETPYGIGDNGNPSPETRKRWKRWIETVPEFDKDVQVPKKVHRRESTPLSQLYRKCWNKLTGLPNDVDANNDALSMDTEIIAGEESFTANTEQQEATPHRPLTSNQMNGNKVGLLDIPAAVSPIITKLRSEGGVNTQLNQLNQLLLLSPNGDANSLDEGSKLPMRRQSIMETASSPKSPATVNMSSENKTIETAIKESQSDVIGWADHSRNNSKEGVIGTTVVAAIAQTEEVSNPDPPKFMLSAIEDREHYIEIIKSLGGTVSEHQSFEVSASHLVTTRPARSEKLLASIASGKWILSITYLDDSYKQGHFLAEEDYEWGNPSAAAAGNLTALKPNSIDIKLAEAGYRWRQRLVSSTEKGAFEGIRAIVCSAPERIPALTRLILAGGGTIENARSPFSDPITATHCFVEMNKVAVTIDIAALFEKGVLCLPPIFLNNYLISEQPLVAENWVIPEYKELQDRRKCN